MFTKGRAAESIRAGCACGSRPGRIRPGSRGALSPGGHKVSGKAVVLAAMLAVVIATSTQANAGCDISDYVGWNIIYSGTVTGYIDEDGHKNENPKRGFEGCEYGRVLIVDYTKEITCDEYHYAYAFHPAILIMSDGVSRKACIDNEMYDIR